jgi:formate dehydrogenase subunit delta
METRDMVRMANQIGGFFKSYGPVEGRKEIANHINSFWEPRMRRDLFKYLAEGGNEFSPEVMAAIDLIRKPANEAA